eukprot:6108913-Amphidinium_carterae.2
MRWIAVVLQRYRCEANTLGDQNLYLHPRQEFPDHRTCENDLTTMMGQMRLVDKYCCCLWVCGTFVVWECNLWP